MKIISENGKESVTIETENSLREVPKSTLQDYGHIKSPKQSEYQLEPPAHNPNACLYSKNIECDVCSRDSSFFCENCNEFYCNECFKISNKCRNEGCEHIVLTYFT